MTLTEIEELISKATPGPWELRNDWEFGTVRGDFIGGCSASDVPMRECQANAELIAAARTLLPQLLEVAKAAKAFNELDIIRWETGKQPEGLKAAWDRFQAALEAFK